MIEKLSYCSHIKVKECFTHKWKCSNLLTMRSSCCSQWRKFFMTLCLKVLYSFRELGEVMIFSEQCLTFQSELHTKLSKHFRRLRIYSTWRTDYFYAAFLALRHSFSPFLFHRRRKVIWVWNYMIKKNHFRMLLLLQPLGTSMPGLKLSI